MLPINFKCQWPHVKSFPRASSGVSRICCLSQYLSLDLVAAAFRPSEQLVWVAFDPTLNLIFAGPNYYSIVCLSICLPVSYSQLEVQNQQDFPNWRLCFLSFVSYFQESCFSCNLLRAAKDSIQSEELDSNAHKHSAAFKGFSWCCNLIKCLAVLAEFSSQQF